ncbi:MAG: hypothetical protein HQM08_12605 [Candidatus Riflebacteria bacterium]|nr:hypothetical protein [Candidatus Riflebacteria bacterium]
MNISKIVFFILVIFALFFYVAFKTIVFPLNSELDTLQGRLAQIKLEENIARDKLQTVSKTVLKPAASAISKNLLEPGLENRLLNGIFDSASKSGALIEDAHFLPVFTKSPPTETEKDNQPASITEKFAMLGEDGMPIGCDTDDTLENKPIEVLPVRLKLKGNFKAWGQFLTFLDQSLNLYGIRFLKTEFNTAGIGSGLIEVVLPIRSSNEK